MGRRLALVAFAAAAAVLVGGGGAAAAPVSFDTAFTYDFPIGDHSVRSLTVGDLNGDGRPDIVAGEFGGKMGVFLNDGHGGFGEPQFYNTGCPNAGQFLGNAGVAIGHFTHSGHMDILFGCDWHTDGFVIYAGNGNGTFQPGRRIEPIEMYLGEDNQRHKVFGGIGMQNLVHGDFAGTQAVVWDEWQVGGGAPQLCMLPDSEIAADTGTTASPNAPHCSIEISPDQQIVGEMEFGRPVVLGTLPFPAAGTSFAFTETPADEQLNNDSMRAAFFDPSNPGFSWNDFEPPHEMAFTPVLLGATDLNGDGSSELIAEGGPNFDQIAVYQLASYVDNLGTLIIPDPVLYPSSPALSQMYGAVAGDFDGDGKPDVAVLGEHDGSTYAEVLPGDGHGALGSPQSVQVADFASDSYVGTGDFNGDGKGDLVTIVDNELKVLLDVTPTISSIAPTRGPVGTLVTVTGANLDSARSVKLNGVPARIIAVSPTEVTFTVPAGATTGHVAVTVRGGTVTSTQQFIVAPTPPTINAVSPPEGHVGTTVTIVGRNFTGASSVRFDGTPAVSFLVVSPTTLTAVVPVGATTGHVGATTPGGSAVSLSTFTVLAALAAPAITSFTPSFGIHGLRVTIRGSGFTGATQVAFNGKPALFTVVNDSTISAIVPAGATSGHIRVTTPAGTVTSVATFSIL